MAAKKKIDDATYVTDLVGRIIDECPRRLIGSDDERRAQEILADEFRQRGFEPATEPFQYNENLYKVLALHFGLGVAGSVLFLFSPFLALAAHLLPAVSYLLDSTKQASILRELFPKVSSRNVVVNAPAETDRKLRVVLIAHADAAYTGWLFDPNVIRRGAHGNWPRALQFLNRPVYLATMSLFLLAVVDAFAWLSGGQWCVPALLLYAALTIPTLIGFVGNMQMVINNQVVPGAADNLSGCAGLLLLADRLDKYRSKGVELVYVVSGGEEAGLGGAWALQQSRSVSWRPEDTVVIAYDTVSNGDLRWYIDGEVVRTTRPGWLDHALLSAAARKKAFNDVCGHEIQSGATDAAPFIYAGYPGIGIGCVDPDIGAPRHYHWPTDTVDNMDGDMVVKSADFVDALVGELIKRHPNG